MTTQHPLAAALFIDASGSAQMRSALDEVISRQGGRVVSGMGGQVFAIFTLGDPSPSAAAQAAMDAHQRAKAMGVAIHAGLSCGPLAVTEGGTQLKAEGPCVMMAAQLHKLLPQPGLALVDADTSQYLAMGLRKLCKPVGKHDLDGIGPTEVCSIDWGGAAPAAAAPSPARKAAPTPATPPVAASAPAPAAAPAPVPAKNPRLELAIGRIREILEPDGQRVLIGRSHYAKVRLVHADVSREHVHLYWEDGAWQLRDMSTNGTFIRARGADMEMHVRSKVVPLPAAGTLCLGQTFAQDAVNGATTIEFEQV